MNRHLSVMLIVAALAMLATASCQTSQKPKPNAPTQIAQAAFERAIAAAQTQSAAEKIYVQPTEGPAFREMPAGATDLQGYLAFATRNFLPDRGLAQTTTLDSVKYVPDSHGAPVHVDVLLTKAAGVQDSRVYAMVFTAFEQLYANPRLTQTVEVPRTLNTFKVAVQDQGSGALSNLGGNWVDVMALGRGELSFQDFLSRLSPGD